MQASGGSETRPDGDEALVETERTLTLEHLGNAVSETVVELGVGGLVHKSSTDDVERRHSARHEETGREGGHELKRHTIGNVGLEDTLARIVASHLGGIEDHSTHNVGLDTLIETGKALSLHDLAGENLETLGLNTLISHHSRLEDIERVTGKGADTTGERTSQELAEETGILFVGADDTLDGLVETETEGGVGGLSQPGGTNTLVEGGGTLVGEHTLDDAGDTVVLLGRATSLTGDLEASLDDINGMDEGDSDDGGTTGACNVLEELARSRRFSLGGHVK